MFDNEQLYYVSLIYNNSKPKNLKTSQGILLNIIYIVRIDMSEAVSRSFKTHLAEDGGRVEEDLRKFNLGLASGLRRAQNRSSWRTLTGTATSPTSSD